MRAMVFEKKLQAITRDVPMPVPNENQALVKVIACGICGGDLHFYDGTHPYSNYPRIAGHELVGVVEALPEGYTRLKIGDRVVTRILFSCGNCYPCRNGKPNCCANLQVLGIHVEGGYAEYTVVPADNLHKLPDAVSIDAAVLTEPYTIGYHIVTRSNIREQETALVLGAGTIGLTVIDVLKAKGIRVLVCDISEYRLEKAKALGADIAINPKKEPLLQRVLEETGGEGAGVVYEATGVPAVIESTFDLTAASGTIVIAGLTKEKVAFTGTDFTRKELTVLGSRNATEQDFDPVLEMMSAGQLHPDVLLTQKINIENAAKEIEALHTDASHQIKSAIYF